MEKKGPILAVLAEKDSATAAAAAACLTQRSYEVHTAKTRATLVGMLKESQVHIAVIGEVEGSESPFETLREAVMTSPLTSVILVTDAPARDVEEKAEGYGILGHVGRALPQDVVGELLDNFERIREAISESS
jgi:DNA-binding response OmpR family regulator